MAEHAIDIELQIHRLKNLPALPEASAKILEAVNQADIAIEELVHALTLSPSLVARLLGMANSAYFNTHREITDIHSAIVQVLGLDLVKSFALCVVVNVHLDASRCRSFDSEYFWTRSLLAALITQHLARLNDCHSHPLSTAYSCGLLLNIGMLVAAYLFPEQVNKILANSQLNKLNKVGVEIQNQLGLSHYQLGFHLLKTWGLPSIYQETLQHFDSDQNFGAQDSLPNLVRLSQKLSGILLNNLPQPAGEELILLATESGVSCDSIAWVLDEMSENQQSLRQLACIMEG